MAKWIDGEKLMEYWQEWDWWDNKGIPHCFGYIPDKIVEREMERAPKLKQVIHGYWIETEDLAGNHYINCSICNYYFWLEDESAEQAELFYCPRCGAKMDEEVETDE